MTARILILDIETAPATAHVWGLHKQYLGPHNIVEPTRMICFAAKWLGEKKVMFHDERQGASILRDAIWDLLDEADVVVHYNGKSFDIPQINRELLLGGYHPPSPYAQVDLYHTMRSQFRFMSNKLDEVAKELGIGAKTAHEGMSLWADCMAGDEAAWRKMKRYNKQDVLLTERLYQRVLPWIRTHPAIGLINGKGHTCPRCGHDSLQKRGFAHTALSTYQQWQCNGCGSYSRSTVRLDTADKKG